MIIRLVVVLFLAPPLVANPVRIAIQEDVVAEVSPLLWGQFLERASWSGEMGAELLIREDGSFDPAIVEMVRAYAPPIVRFPGGTFLSLSADYEWEKLIDHAPGRAVADRPSTCTDHKGNETTTRFGFDELFELRAVSPFETILVVEWEDAFMNREPLETAAVDNAAAMVAYVNGEVGKDLPGNLEKFVEARVRNGHPEPFGVKYWQIGNEWFIVWDRLHRDDDPTNDPDLAWAAEVFIAYVDAMKAVDPEIVILGETNLRGDEQDFYEIPGVRERTDIVVQHSYWPVGHFDTAQRLGESIPINEVPAKTLWYDWVAGMGFLDEHGVIQALDRRARVFAEEGFPIGLTEWNWNGWGNRDNLPAEANVDQGVLLGAGGFLHGMLRASEHISLATMSMFVGNGWNIATIRVPDEGTPFFSPQGQVVKLYREHAGDRRLRIDVLNPRFFDLPVISVQGWKRPPEPRPVQTIDPVVTATDERIIVHLLNRSFDETIPVEIDGSALRIPPGSAARVVRLRPRSPEASLEDGQEVFLEETFSLPPVMDGVVRLDLAPRSVSFVLIERQ